VNPLQKARDGAGSAWSKSRDGTKRTAGWVKGGVTGAFGKVRSGAASVGGGASERASDATAPIRDGLAGTWDRVGGGALMHRARSDSRIGAAVVLGAILFVLWIAWTAYVWTENGSTAGLGVLISWPAVVLALGLIAAPFVAATMLVRRLAANREPALAGGAVPATAEPEQEADASGSGDEDADEEGEPEDENEEDDSEDEDPDDEDSEAA